MSAVIDTQCLELTYRRVARVEPRHDVCDWCHQRTDTFVTEVWSLAFPEGRLVRVCEPCASGCAGG